MAFDPFCAVKPLLHQLDPEFAHGLTIKALRFGSGLLSLGAEPVRGLETTVFGLNFPNPLGLAAGFDKNAEVPDAMLALALGFVEVGTVTPEPQRGNARPRIFRLENDAAVINRLGFNSEGADAVKGRLAARGSRGGILGINLGANWNSEKKISDYVTGLHTFYEFASYITVNISSPNTPGLRDLQSEGALVELIGRVHGARKELMSEGGKNIPILFKIAPDLDEEGVRSIAQVALAHEVDGLIVSNTTISRPVGLAGDHAVEAGGLSGAPLYDLSTRILAQTFQATEGRIPLIGVGGVGSGEQAYGKILAGASLVQLYTALIYEGPGLVRTILNDLKERLQADGYRSVQEAVGVKAAEYATGKE